MATQLADRRPHPNLWKAKFKPPHFLSFSGDFLVRELT